MTKHKHYYAIRAYADGWKIEYKNYLNTWCLALNPVFEGNREYRVIPDENGWLPWYGGECPVDPDTTVEVRVGYFVGKSRKARDYNCGSFWGSNITAYRVIEEKADPYAELKAAAKDPTKQIRCGKNGTWADAGTAWAWERPVQDYEIRNKPKKMKLLAYIDTVSGELLLRLEGYKVSPYWKRFPAEDIEGEVEE